MDDNHLPMPGADEPPPAASLTAIPLRSTNPDEPPPGPKKAGDITQQLAAGRGRPQLAVASPGPAPAAPEPGPAFRHLPADAAARLASLGRAGPAQVQAQVHRQVPPELADPPAWGWSAPRNPGSPGEISVYWRELKRGRRFPARADLDTAHIALHWPNAMLLVCEGGAGQVRPDAAFSEALREAKLRAVPGAAEYVEYTTMVVEWVLNAGRTAARLGRPVHDTKPFSTTRGEVRYRVLALPLGGSRAAVDHILCNVTHAP